jgi:hypothetical protein
MITSSELKLIKELYDKGAVIHTKTHQESLKLAKILNAAGYIWCNNLTYIELNQWNTYKVNTVHYISQGSYGSLEGALENDYIITEFSNLFYINTEIKYLL